MSRYVFHIARRAGLVALFVAAAVLGTASGIVVAYAGDLPRISALDDYTPSTITRVYARGGEVVGEFATERRLVIRYDDMAPRLREAILAAEDADFDRHFGFSVSRIFITAIKDLIEWRKAGGASTLTQQLARKLFLTDEKTWERKIKETILAIQIEKRYTKREILTLYANQIYFGQGAYGVEAASRLYFDKQARDLNLEEAALIAGIIQTPERQSPFVDVRRATSRRNYVLERMADEGYISRADAEAAMKLSVATRGSLSRYRSIAPYFVEEVRQHLEANYGAKRLYEDGLSVQTTMDLRLQQAANRAVTDGLRRLDKRLGFRRPTRNIIAQGQHTDTFKHERWQQPLSAGDIVPAIVTGLDGARAQVRVGPYNAVLDKAAIAWTGRASAAQLFKPGDLIEVRLDELRKDAHTAVVSLEQTPQVEGALLAIDNRTGGILAMVGGYSFERSKFNRAVQAFRQLGSAFKPVVFTAAIDRGYTPASILLDTPASFPAGPDQPEYTPQNYDNQWEGSVTLRHALEDSRNVPAVRVMDELGPTQVVAYARRFGIESPLPPFLSVALGAAESTLIEMTSAYSVFPNQGVHMKPFQILRVTDRAGNVLEENRPEPHDGIRADTAYVMTNLLRGVVLRGTAAKAASLDWPLAGKTGTVDDFTDAWFIGFDPDITVGVWVGRDEKKPLGTGQTGAEAALPIWIDFMKAHINGRTSPPGFPQPGNIVFVPVDRHTGALAGSSTTEAISEAFIAGTQPGTEFPGQ